ncbi:MAG: type IX secretion system protein PorQ [Flavobacteriales bacterium]|nr:type IX secretion system protein PorQ [Flavobacteriales bacterium]
MFLGVNAQLNESVYQFSNLFPTARLSATNGTSATVNDSDISSVIFNPALVNEGQNGQVLLSYTNYVSDINYLNAAYGFQLADLGSFVGFVSYFDYGKFVQYDEFGQSTGEFNVSDYQLGIAHGRSLHSQFYIGGITKFNFSNYYRFTSFGFGLDLAIDYFSQNGQFNAMIRMRNLGMEIFRYNEKNYLTNPSIDFGFSQKLAKAPLRVAVLYNHLQKWDLTSEETIVSEDQLTEQRLGFNNFMKHFTFSGSFIPSRNFAIHISYNHKVRDEMTLVTRGGLSGFGFGVDMKIKKIQIQYALNSRAIKGMSNQFTLVSKFSDWKKVNN